MLSCFLNILGSTLKVVIRILYQIKEQNQQILSHLSKSSHVVNNRLPEIPVNLPVHTQEDIDTLENYLVTRENLFALVCFFILFDK